MHDTDFGGLLAGLAGLAAYWRVWWLVYTKKETSVFIENVFYYHKFEGVACDDVVLSYSHIA